MDNGAKLPRRRFMKLCASMLSMVSGSPQLLANQSGALRHYPRAQLVDADGVAVTPATLVVGKNYLFHYPYISTPCFLLNLGRPARPGVSLTTENGRHYRWEGGVGPKQAVVAFSAICAHKMSYPARSVSFINYRHEQIRFASANDGEVQRSRVIYCCSENSVYDPARGARVLGGPAPQPLAAIRLDYHRDDGSLYATGVYGGELFDKFFAAFGFHLSLELLTTDIREPVTDKATVLPLTEYCRQQILC